MERARRYTQMRELQRLKKEGGSYDKLKVSITNGTTLSTTTTTTSATSYKNLIGRQGSSLQQRLQILVAYKRSTSRTDAGESGLTREEELELDDMMESDDDDEILEGEDDEEAEYEAAVLKAMEENKLKDIRRNMLLDKTELRDSAQEVLMTETFWNCSDEIKEEETPSVGMIRPDRLMLDISPSDMAPTAYPANLTTNTNLSNCNSLEEDLYTPSRSSWGVFERPRDISKTFGGGRVITRAEMDAMDEEFSRQEEVRAASLESWKGETLRKENANEEKIRKALDWSRTYMLMGDTKKVRVSHYEPHHCQTAAATLVLAVDGKFHFADFGHLTFDRHPSHDVLLPFYQAVTSLEGVSDYCSWQSDFGGEVLLELGMCLETVNRTDEARKIYGKLISVSWSSKIRRNALQLLQGLDIAKQIRNDVNPRKPLMDGESLNKVKMAFEVGLRNEWNEYSKKDKPSVTAWYDEIKEVTRVETLKDAYAVLQNALNPLKTVPSALLAQALRHLHLLNEKEKMDFLRARGVLSCVYVAGPKQPPALQARASQPQEGTFFASIGLGVGAAAGSLVSDMGGENQESDQRSAFAMMSDDLPPVEKQRRVISSLSLKTTPEVFVRAINGTWDLVASLVDVAPYRTKRFESGELRRVIDMPRDRMGANPAYDSLLTYHTAEPTITETVPILWGLGMWYVL